MTSYRDSARFRHSRSDLVQAVRDGEDLPDEEWDRLWKLATPQQRRTADLIVDPTLAPHGSASTYSNWGCRCDDCRTAHAAKDSRTARAERDFDEPSIASEESDVIQRLKESVKLGHPLTPKGQAILDEWEASRVI